MGGEGLVNMGERLEGGGEMYGLGEMGGDMEVIELMVKRMKIADMGEVLVWLGELGVFGGLCDGADLD
ncbi:ATP phosphoribosyltransferase regulatory subunit, partial [Neisseria sicca]|uniref:ATP phosphoribosyltransferase regulatory subunit n=1 Tax=Neisseria sicca TaxID=490 RepID=UPI0028FC1849